VATEAASEEGALLGIKAALSFPNKEVLLAAWVPGFDYCAWLDTCGGTSGDAGVDCRLTCNAGRKVNAL
jgi:hypothetical protein